MTTLFLVSAFGGGRVFEYIEEIEKRMARIHLASQSTSTFGGPGPSLYVEEAQRRMARIHFAVSTGGTGRLDSRYMAEAEKRTAQVDEISILCSFHYFKTTALKDVVARFPSHTKVNVFADSGGFSAMTLGETVKLTDYVRWLRKNLEHLSVYANLDVIGDPEKTKRNQAIMEAEGLAPIPVFHVGSDFKYLEEMVARYPYIAIGGMVPYLKDGAQRLGHWLWQAFKIIGSARVHGFGIGTTWDIARGFPWESIDASSWTSILQYRQGAVFDAHRGRFTTIDFGSQSKEIFQHAELLRSYGFGPADFYPPERFNYTNAGALAVMSTLRAERWLKEYGVKHAK